MNCERCGAGPKGEYGIHDYCARCSKNLCDQCMERGCCGVTPAESGMGDDEDLEDGVSAASPHFFDEDESGIAHGGN